jgi:hypothetical protein
MEDTVASVKVWISRRLAFLLAAGLGAGALAQGAGTDRPLLRHLVMEAVYVREAADTAWHIRIADRLPTPPGLYAIVYGERGDVVLQAEIPSGTYSPEKPFELTIPRDGAAQQYVIKILGVDQNVNAVTLPLTDLPLEVYGGRNGGTFVMPYPTNREIRRLAFQTPPGEGPVVFVASDQILRVFDSDGALVADNRPASGANQATNSLLLSRQPGKTLWLDPGNANQFGTARGTEKLFVAFDPERWFLPALAWDLESRPWWKGLNNP